MYTAQNMLSLIELSDQLYFSFNLRGEQFTYMNPAFGAFFNTDDKIHFLTLFEMVHPADKDYLLVHLRNCKRGVTIHNAEIRFIVDGIVSWLRISATRIDHESGDDLIAGVAANISGIKSYVDVLQKHNAKKNAILNILSHDLAGPIGVIDNISTVLKRAVNKWNDPKVEQYIALISKTSKACVQLINGFVNQEFLESSSINLLKQRVDLAARIRDTISEYQLTQKELGVTFIFKSSQLSLYVDVDEDKFLQVINNLTSNSLKFTPEGGRIMVTLEETDMTVILIIQDDGIGIPGRFHANLFDKFTSARRTGLHGEQSTGLGMSIIKTIIEWHGGSISFKSAENEGTSFYISLPK